jgi:hypothetical protein
MMMMEAAGIEPAQDSLRSGGPFARDDAVARLEVDLARGVSSATNSGDIPGSPKKPKQRGSGEADRPRRAADPVAALVRHRDRRRGYARAIAELRETKRSLRWAWALSRDPERGAQ